jgi:hypothetical protein
MERIKKLKSFSQIKVCMISQNDKLLHAFGEMASSNSPILLAMTT